jgi:hypothetical protein
MAFGDLSGMFREPALKLWEFGGTSMAAQTV